MAIVVGLALVAVAPAQGKKGGVDPKAADEAARALQSTLEADVRKGGELCLALKVAIGIDFLLAELGSENRKSNQHLPQEHYRDIAWESLVRVTDPYLRERVEHALGEAKRNPFLREWCAELLGEYADADLGRALIPALSDKEDVVVRAAARAAGKARLEKALVPLGSLARHKDPIVRANAVEALARIAPEKQREGFLKAL
ncbi:MAG: HEAT repeat domain-containing protein [Planctomycetes bacterium]|nr:HEAT repeat domain-containing protein [Planctomycetota bacterium]